MTAYCVEAGFRFGCLRRLRLEDTVLMLEWMHDPDIAGRFKIDFGALCEDDVRAFVEASWRASDSLHFAVVGQDDVYLGTVSLKHIDSEDGSAEYAISLRRCAHGTGMALCATRDVVRYAFDELGLRRVYLDVRPDNQRAIRFYRKAGFVRSEVISGRIKTDDESIDLLRFVLSNDEYERIADAGSRSGKKMV
jgi:diamine N-acetyltransferase